MRTKVLILTLFIAMPSFSEAQTFNTGAQCDCSVVEGECRARIQKDGNFIVVESNNEQCSRVTWYADEQPQTTIVVNGKEIEEWLGQKESPFLSVDSCQVCADARQAKKVEPAPKKDRCYDYRILVNDEFLAGSSCRQQCSSENLGACFAQCTDTNSTHINHPDHGSCRGVYGEVLDPARGNMPDE